MNDIASELPTLDPNLDIADDALQQAYHDLVNLDDAADKDREQFIKAYAALLDGYHIAANGDLLVSGSSGTYHVNTTFCGKPVTRKNGKHGLDLCKGFLRSGGSCYHTYAYRIVLGAQTLLLAHGQATE